MYISQENNTYISIKNLDGTIENKFTFCFARAGYGKSLAMEALIEEYHRAGYVVMILSDVKGEFEMAYAMFEPEKSYHTWFLEYIGKPIEKKEVKLYHPFTFKIPKNKLLPPMQFYGFPLKSLHRSEWSMIAESAFESETIRVLLNACQNLGKNEGIHSFLHNIQDTITGKRDRKKLLPDFKNFGVSVTPATAKSLQDIVSFMLPFKSDYFLTSEDSDLSLDWAQIMNDQKPYHVFSTYWIQDEKLQQFTILGLLEAILRNKQHARKPILLVIPEIRHLTPYKPEGYKKFLAEAIKKRLSVMRSQGRGFSAYFDSQVWTDVDENVKNSATFTVYGELGGAGDIDRVSKALNYKREFRDKLKKMADRNSYLVQGKEDMEEFTLWFPGHMHSEPEYNFFEMFASKHPDKRVSNENIYNKVLDFYKREEEIVKQKVKEKIEKEEQTIEAIRKEKEKRKEEVVKGEKVKQKKTDDKARLAKMEAVYLLFKENPSLSWRDVGKRVELFHGTAKKYYEEYEEYLLEKQKTENPQN